MKDNRVIVQTHPQILANSEDSQTASRIRVRLTFAFTLVALLVGISVTRATPYATYNADINQTPADPSSQGWLISGGLSQGVDDNGTLAWELNDNNGDSNPTMSSDYGVGNEPEAGDSWSFSVNARVLHGNGSATSVIMWSDGTIRYLFFIYENNSGNINVLYWNTSGNSTTLNDYVVNDDGYQDSCDRPHPRPIKSPGMP